MLKILFASRLVHEKWVDILMDCIRTFDQDIDLKEQIEWHICSDGEEQDTIYELTKKYKNITYYGRIQPEKIIALYKTCSILFMPSRFIETFGLTALEAIHYGMPVCAPKKWWLTPFVTTELTLNESDPVHSFYNILKKRLQWDAWSLPNIEKFSIQKWHNTLEILCASSQNILIAHDYEEKIGWAEYYIETVKTSLQNLWKNVSFYGYRGKTTVWKRRIMFICSIFSFWRGIQLYNLLRSNAIDTVWMHSVLRYIGPWWVLAVKLYQKKVKVYLSHHDLGLLTAFPQNITQESSIPMSSSLDDFIPHENRVKKLMSIGKYIYIRLIRWALPVETTHIIFSSFLEKNMRGQFGNKCKIYIFPHRVIVQTSSSIKE